MNLRKLRAINKKLSKYFNKLQRENRRLKYKLKYNNIRNNKKIMNNEENIRCELNELLEENLIKDFKFIKSDINILQFQIITLEDIHLAIETSTNYCYKVTNINDNSSLYESFESLLRKHSDLYSQKFGEIIANRLNKLISIQNSELEEEY